MKLALPRSPRPPNSMSLMAIAVAVAFAASPRDAGADRPARPLVVVSPSSVDPPLDPRSATLASKLSVAGDLLFSRLYLLREDGTVSPHLVETDEIRTEGDRTVLSLTLRRGVSFARWDAEREECVEEGELTAQDVEYTIRSILDGRVVGSFLDDLRGIDSTKVVDTYRIDLYLATESPTLRRDLTLPIVPASFAAPLDPEEKGGPGRFASSVETLAGSGPYVLRRAKIGSLTLQRNSHYWNDDYRPREERLLIREVEDQGARVIAIKAGEVDVCLPGFHTDQWLQLVADPSVETSVGGAAAFQFVGFNLERDVVSDLRVRKAIAYAVDYDGFAGFLGGLAAPCQTFFLDDHWAYPPALRGREYTQDLERANRLLDEAGWTERDARTGMRAGLELEVSYASWREFFFTILQSNLKKVGIEAKPRSLESAVFWEKVDNARDFEVMLGGGIYDSDPSNYAFYFTGESPATFNAYGYRNDRVTELLTSARGELDFERRQALYREAILTVHEELPVLVLFQFVNHFAWRAGLQGVGSRPPANLLALTAIHR